MKTARFLILLAAAGMAAFGQPATPTPNFIASYNFSDGNLRQVVDGTVINFPAVDINAAATAVITIGNTGTAAGLFTSATVTGDGFQVAGLPLMPASIAPGQGLRFGITFTPPKSGSFRGSFQIELGGRVISGTLAGATAAPSLSLAYVDPRTNNLIALADGATLQFPDTPAGANSTVTLLAPNTGKGTGEIRSVTIGDNFGGVFELLNLTPVPISVPPSYQFRFAIRFSSPEAKLFATTLSLDLNGQPITVKLAAQATGPQYTYTYGGDAAAVPAGGTITFPETLVGQTSKLTVTILNAGSGNGQIGGIGATGQGFAVSDLPLFPLTLHPKDTQQFTLSFTPTQPGALTGRLVIGGELILLAGKNIGPQLTYTYATSSSPVAVAEAGTVFLPPTSVGGSQKAEIKVQNTGTGAATLSSITVSAAGKTFAVQDVPGLPFNLEAGNSVAFSLIFTPNTTGALAGILRVNTAAFNVSGTGTEPASLPAYQLTASSLKPQPASQPTIGLALASPYPFALQGTVTLSFLSDVFTDDPAIQFASGGRTVKFTVPANSTQALFNSVSTAMPIQVGTTAGNIVLTPSFALQVGYDLTPPSPATLSITVPRSAPQLLSGAITNQTLNSFSLTFTGYATTKSLRQLDIQFTPKSGEAFVSTRVTLDVTSTADSWFQTAASQQAGGGFQISIPFTLQNGSATDDLVHRIQSLSITATNDIGTSSPLVVAIP